jgi:hypothetical protein
VSHHLIVSPGGERTEHCGRVTKVPATMSDIGIFRQSGTNTPMEFCFLSP